jgi:hypothetical protein
MIKRATKKNINLNSLSTGCSPCLNEAKKIEQQIGDRKVSSIKLEEIKKIISSLFDKKIN